MNDLILVGEVMAKLAVNFWPVVAFAIAVQIGVWVAAARENRNRLRKMKEGK